MTTDLVGDFIDAAVQDQERAASLLLQHPDLRESRWIHQETPLHFLAVEGYTEAVLLLGRLGFDPNTPNEFGDPPLIDVAVLGNDEMAAALLSLGADSNAQSETYDNALHCAVRSGNSKLVEVLLKAGATANYVTDIGESVFDVLPDDDSKRERILTLLSSHVTLPGPSP